MKQLIEPNLPGKGTIGRCLQYVRERFGIPAKYLTAAEARLHVEQHLGPPPTDVKVFLWFRWKTDDHVVINAPGVGLYSSPMKAGEDYHLFSSIASVEKFLGAKYLYWSPDVNGVKVAEEDDMLTPSQLDKLIKAFKGADPTSEELNNQTYMDNPGLAIDTFFNTWGLQLLDQNNNPNKPVKVSPYEGPPLYTKG